MFHSSTFPPLLTVPTCHIATLSMLLQSHPSIPSIYHFPNFSYFPSPTLTFIPKYLSSIVPQSHSSTPFLPCHIPIASSVAVRTYHPVILFYLFHTVATLPSYHTLSQSRCYSPSSCHCPTLSSCHASTVSPFPPSHPFKLSTI
jgi:hypothetical protein